jgi:subtilisin family serine protease
MRTIAVFFVPVLSLVALAMVGCGGESTDENLQGVAARSATAPEARVWIVFKNGQKNAVKLATTRAGARLHHEFDELRALAASLPAAAVETLRGHPHVELIEEDPPRSLSSQTVPFGIDLVQARDIWDVDRNGLVDSGAHSGEDRLVCVVDSGIFTGHEDLAGLAVGGYPDGWNTDGCGHGTHVSGTIGAVSDTAGVVGAAPGVHIYMVRVFGDDCAWAYSSDLVDAVSRCQDAGANVINMSLGGGAPSSTEQAKFDSLWSAGILSVAAAGNAGSSAFNYPASYPSVISVAAVDQNQAVASFSQYNSQVDLAAPGVAVLSTVPKAVSSSLVVDGVSYAVVDMINAAQAVASGALVDGGLCDTAPIPGSWAGKVVLCQRGTVSFYDKVLQVQTGGGVAALVYNNVAGSFGGTLGDGHSSTIPVECLSQEDGQYLVRNKIGATADVSTIVLSSPVSGYEAWDGTSMATPHVSAVAALIWSADPNKTNVQVRKALEATALDLGTPGRDNYYGYGLVQAKAALAYLQNPPPSDTTPPVITSVASAKTNSSGGFQITWTTNELSNSEVRFTAPVAQTFTNASLVTSHKMTFTGSKKKKYTYYVSSTDAAGNTTSKGPYNHQN